MKKKRLIATFLIAGFLISIFMIFFKYYSWVGFFKTKPIRGIILISLDTLRADHLGIYGYHRDTSPFIDAFAKESIVFESAVAQASGTLASHMSIMTSLYPSFHGVTTLEKRLANEHLTLAELLREGGYQTAAFTDGAQVRPIFGFDQGFDVYKGKRKRGIAQTLTNVKKWLSKNKSNPFFLFIHCYDIHAPYNPPPPYNSIFRDFTHASDLITIGKTTVALPVNESEVDNDYIHHKLALYDGGIRYTDEKIGEFLSYLRDSGLEDQSLIIITSDHGEEFMEHGGFSHSKIYYRPNLHVPLIMRIPHYPKKEIRINGLVQSIDLLPTILEIAGLPAHPNAQGRSLLPLIKRHKDFLNRSLSEVFHPFQNDSTISFSEDYGIKNCSIISDGYQMIYNLKSHSIQLFDLKTDPLAQNNIAKDNDDIAERLLSRFKEVYSVIPSYKALKINLDEETRDQLKALGYIDEVGQ